MRKNYLLFALVFVAFTFFAKSAAAIDGTGVTENKEIKENKKKSDILGTVYHNESRKPLRDVVVTAYFRDRKESRATTDHQGNYSFADLKPGIYRLVFERDGFRKVSRDKVMIKTENGFQLDIAMEELNDFEWIPGVFNFLGGD